MGIQCVILLTKSAKPNFQTYVRHFFHTKIDSWQLDNENIFSITKIHNSYGNIVHKGNPHACAKFGHVIMDYAMDVTMVMGIWLENHACSY